MEIEAIVSKLHLHGDENVKRKTMEFYNRLKGKNIHQQLVGPLSLDLAHTHYHLPFPQDEARKFCGLDATEYYGQREKAKGLLDIVEIVDLTALGVQFGCQMLLPCVSDLMVAYRVWYRDTKTPHDFASFQWDKNSIKIAAFIATCSATKTKITREQAGILGGNTKECLHYLKELKFSCAELLGSFKADLKSGKRKIAAVDADEGITEVIAKRPAKEKKAKPNNRTTGINFMISTTTDNVSRSNLLSRLNKLLSL